MNKTNKNTIFSQDCFQNLYIKNIFELEIRLIRDKIDLIFVYTGNKKNTIKSVNLTKNLIYTILCAKANYFKRIYPLLSGHKISNFVLRAQNQTKLKSQIKMINIDEFRAE